MNIKCIATAVGLTSGKTYTVISQHRLGPTTFYLVTNDNNLQQHYPANVFEVIA